MPPPLEQFSQPNQPLDLTSAPPLTLAEVATDLDAIANKKSAGSKAEDDQNPEFGKLTITKTNDAEHLKLPKSDWTLAVDLTLESREPAKTQTKLKEMAVATKDSNVTVVVQYGTGPENNQILHRCVMHGGKIIELPAIQSGGLKSDIKSLVQYSTTVAPSDKVGLIITSHGGGARGLKGETGISSLSDTRSAIEQGLKGSGHPKLDLLDFDSCLMANATVLDGMQNLASHIIASENTEKGNAQNLPAMLGYLSSHSKEETGQLMTEIINSNLANLDKTNNGAWESNDTLAHFDMQQYREFKGALNRFGYCLSRAAMNGDNLSKINKAIHESSCFPELFGDGDWYQYRDLKGFAGNIIESIKHGNILDPDGQLQASAQKILQTEQSVTAAYHGSIPEQRQNLGGLSVFLPDYSLRDTHAGALRNTPLAELVLLTDDEMAYNIKNKAECLPQLDKKITAIMCFISEQDKARMSGLLSDRKRLDTASTAEEFSACIRQLHNDAEQLMKGFVGNNLAAADGQFQAYRNQRFDYETVTPNAGWNGFVELLRITDGNYR